MSLLNKIIPFQIPQIVCEEILCWRGKKKEIDADLVKVGRKTKTL